MISDYPTNRNFLAHHKFGWVEVAASVSANDQLTPVLETPFWDYYILPTDFSEWAELPEANRG